MAAHRFVWCRPSGPGAISMKNKKGIFAAVLIAAALTIATASLTLAGTADMKVKMWKLPSDTHYPHDPLVSHDGYIWYSGNKSNNIGRFDPKTETFKEWSTDI